MDPTLAPDQSGVTDHPEQIGRWPAGLAVTPGTWDGDAATAAKRQAARAVAARVQSGMVLGLGSGSTAGLFLDALGERLKGGELNSVAGAATSEATATLARRHGIQVLAEDDCPALDLAVDGADEVEPGFGLLKGRGGALLREKLVAAQARHFLVIADATKLVERLGTTGPLPIEVVPFAYKLHQRWLEGQGATSELRLADDGSPYRTDNAHFILHATFPGGVLSPHSLATDLDRLPGVLEHGLFLHMATEVVVGFPDRAETVRRD